MLEGVEELYAGKGISGNKAPLAASDRQMLCLPAEPWTTHEEFVNTHPGSGKNFTHDCNGTQVLGLL